MDDQGVPVKLADRSASIYNAANWESLRRGVANGQFTAVEIKAFCVLGLLSAVRLQSHGPSRPLPWYFSFLAAASLPSVS